MGRRRSVVEHMSEMTPTAAAMDFVTNHAVASIGPGLDRAGEGIVETWASRPAYEFYLRDKQRLVTGGAAVSAGALLVQQRTASGHLRTMLAHDCVLLGRQDFAPLRFGVCDGILLLHVQIPFSASSAGTLRRTPLGGAVT